MCTKMPILWTILVLGSYAEVANSSDTAFGQSTPTANVTTDTTEGPTSSKRLTSTFTPHTTNLISSTQRPSEKDSTTVALTSSTNKDVTKGVALTSPQHTTGSTITNTTTDITHTTASGAETSTETAQTPGIATTAPESATTTTTAPESATTTADAPESATTTTTAPESATTTADAPESANTTTNAPESATTTADAPESANTTTNAPESANTTTNAPESANTTTNAPESANTTTNIDSKEEVAQRNTTAVPVPTTVAQPANSEGSTKPFTSEASQTPVTPTSSAMITSVLTTTPALTTTTTITATTTTMATTRITTTTTTTTTTTALKPKMFNRTIAAISTGDSLERVCAHLMEIINATVNCNMVGKEINGDLKFSSITLIVVDPLVEVNKSTNFKQTEDIHMTSIAIMASCGALALFLIAFAVYCSCHRLSYRKNQQHLTEELQTVENGYHDNPTLEVMEVQPEMQEKKLTLNGEFNDSWIVPFDNFAKDDIPEEEDTHL